MVQVMAKKEVLNQIKTRPSWVQNSTKLGKQIHQTIQNTEVSNYGSPPIHAPNRQPVARKSPPNLRPRSRTHAPKGGHVSLLSEVQTTRT
jgi:hypothetical protein